MVRQHLVQHLMCAHKHKGGNICAKPAIRHTMRKDAIVAALSAIDVEGATAAGGS